MASPFLYRFSLSPGGDPSLPLLIFLPGGPGQSSMDMPISVPDGFSFVRTDPRGIGCNEEEGLPESALSSEAVARDVLAIVKELKPEKYILYGISYGTIPATMAAALAESEGVQPPVAVVLEGTIGRAYAVGEYAEGILREWRAAKAKLPAGLLDKLKKELPFGLSGTEWAAWLSAMLAYGELPSGKNYALSELMILDSPPSNPARKGLEARIKMMAAPPSASKRKLYKEIACREIAPDLRDVKYDFDFVGGELVLRNDIDLCAGVPFDRPFSAAAYPAVSPIYYFLGERDPVTPPYQTAYHAGAQSQARKTVVSVKGGGHQALSMALADCGSRVWQAIAGGDLAEALGSCKAGKKIAVEKIEPGSGELPAKPGPRK